jgi:lipid-A-disaccharide synthase
LRVLPRLLRIRRDLSTRLQAPGCRAFIGVDAPDFNLTLEARLRASGLPTIHYVGPNVWAWRAERIERIRQAADHVLLIFPFEKPIYDQAGIPATYVGHPLASVIPDATNAGAARQQLGLASSGPLFCLMPGSRQAEIDHLMPVFLPAADILARRYPGARFILPVADTSLQARIRALRDRCAPGLDLTLVAGHSHDCLAAADAVMVASGTATLEAALFRKPMVIAYRMPWLSARIMRRIGGYLPWVGLPNILANESLVPELLQEAATPQAIADALSAQLDDAPRQAYLAERYAQLHHSLKRDTGALAAEAILQTVARRQAGCS